MIKAMTLCGAFLAAALGLAQAPPQQPPPQKPPQQPQQAGTHKVILSIDTNPSGAAFLFSLPASGTASGASARIRAGYQAKAIIAEDAAGNWLQCNAVRIILQDKKYLSALKASGMYMTAGSGAVADTLRPAPADDPDALFSYGSCVPFESAVPDSLKEKYNKQGLDLTGERINAYLQYLPVKIIDRNGVQLFGAPFPMIKDPDREARLKGRTPAAVPDVKLDGKACPGTGYINAKLRDAVNPRLCP